MRIYFLACFVCFLYACNNSDKEEKVTGVVNDSTAGRSMTSNAGTIQPVQLTAAQVPAAIKFRGTLYEAWEWTDRSGNNLLVTSLVSPYHDKNKNEYDEEGHTAELHAFHFIKKDTGYKLLWKISDAERICGFDVTADFIKGSTGITDLNNNGIAETTILYKLACRSDVSPANMKLIMHEGTEKFSLRGLMWVKAGEDEEFTVTEKDVNLEMLPKKKDEYEQMTQSFGRYETEKEFAKAPQEFLPHARAHWMKFVKESFE
jgi:hypothetical protein